MNPYLATLFTFIIALAFLRLFPVFPVSDPKFLGRFAKP